MSEFGVEGRLRPLDNKGSQGDMYWDSASGTVRHSTLAVTAFLTYLFVFPCPLFVSSIAQRSSWLQSRTSCNHLWSSFNNIVIKSVYIESSAHMKVNNEVEIMWKALWPNMR